jgi:hypothetical protein
MLYYRKLLLLVITSLVFSHCLFAEDTEVLQPRMKTVDRDWTYFESIPCKDIDKVVYHSPSEETLLAKRKDQCMERYKAFYSRPTAK